MASYTQETRLLAIETPFGKDALLLSGFQGREEISKLSEFNLDLLSESDALAASDIIGSSVAFSIQLADGPQRQFHGYVRSFQRGAKNLQGLRQYQARVVPWLWFLTQTSDCRIFQNKTVPEIIEAVFEEYEIAEFEVAHVKESYPKLEYCVQYRESDFAFVARLMEEVGIFYFFKQTGEKQVLVLSDQSAAHGFCAEREVRYSDGSLTPNHIERWDRSFEFRPGKFAQTDYDFKKPDANLGTNSDTLVDLKLNDRLERFEYPGRYASKDQGRALARIRMEENEVDHDQVSGSGSCLSFEAGAKFKLDSYDETEKGTYVIKSVEHFAEDPSCYQAGADADAGYRNRFCCFPDSVVFRPARTTPKPIVQGPQTGVVVGADGESIYPDELGRVKVKFFWDRSASSDESSSCWIRVSQNWAGAGWGEMHIPHVGHEVIVTFLEGDPDRPIITGRVYNAAQAPPLNLPAERYKSVIARDYFGNEMIMDGTPGDEHIRLHSPHHESTIEIGKSVKYRTDSDWGSITFGDKWENTFGNSYSVEVGAKLGAFLGLNAGLFVGTNLNVSLAGSFSYERGVKFSFSNTGSVSYSNGYSFSHTRGKHIATCDNAYLQRSDDVQTLASMEKIQMVGGDCDQSIISANKKEILLAYGKGRSFVGDPASKTAIQQAAVAGIIAAGLGAASACKATATTMSQVAKQRELQTKRSDFLAAEKAYNEDEGNEHLKAAYEAAKKDNPSDAELKAERAAEKETDFSDVALGATSLLGLMGSAVATRSRAKSILDSVADHKVQHNNTFSQIKLREKTLELCCGDSAGSRLVLHDDGRIELIGSKITLSEKANGEGNHKIEADTGMVTVYAKHGLFQEAKTIKFKGKKIDEV